MRIVVVATVTDGVHGRDAVHVSRHVVVAPCVVAVACHTRAKIVVDRDHVAEKVLFVEVGVVGVLGCSPTSTEVGLVLLFVSCYDNDICTCILLVTI